MIAEGGAMPSSPAETEREIERTRAALALTLDALGRKLTARHLVEKGFDMLKDTFAGYDGLNRGLDVIRANPVPVALIGIGAAWLILANTDVVERIARDERVEAARHRVADLASDVGTRAGELASGIAQRVGLGGDSGSPAEPPLGRTGNSLVDEAGASRSDGWVHQMADMTQDALRSARDSGSAMLNRAGSLAGDGAGRVADRLSEAFERNPLMVGAIGVMAGVLLAAMLPATRVENRLLGGAGDGFRHKAEKAGDHAMPRVREAAARRRSAAADTVRGEADKPSQA